MWNRYEPMRRLFTSPPLGGEREQARQQGEESFSASIFIETRFRASDLFGPVNLIRKGCNFSPCFYRPAGAARHWTKAASFVRIIFHPSASRLATSRPFRAVIPHATL
jgi:hypothetical protein